MTQTEHMTHGMKKTEPLIGNCTNHPDPDLWQPEPENGRPSMRQLRILSERIVIAKTICSSCPAIQRCLQEGSEGNDLPYGIWGGKMAGERILALGFIRDELPRQSDLGKALDFYERMKPHIEEVQSEQMG